METRDLLLLMGFLRGGKMFPVALPQRDVPVARSLRVLYEVIAAEERALFPGVDGGPSAPAELAPSSASAALDAAPQSSHDDLRRRSALTAWSGDFLAWTTPLGEIPDPGVVLCLMYEGPAADAALPIDVFAQTLRRYALRDSAMRARFDAHVNQAGTFVPPWLSPEVRGQRSQEAFDRAMAVAHDQGFAAASPLLEGVRGACYAPAQIAIAVHELHELGDAESALGRLDEVLHANPRHVGARMQRAQILMGDAGRRVEAAADWLVVLRELGRPDSGQPPGELRAAARNGLWALHREFTNARKLEAAAALVKQDPERGFEAVSRYVHTHPCAWDAQLLLASVALGRQSFELTVKLLASVRWLYADDPNPHFVYGQALASKGNIDAAVPALEHAAQLAPHDTDIARWLSFAQSKLPSAAAAQDRMGVNVAHHVARTLLLLVGFVRDGHVHPAALTLHRVPGDVSLTLVVQALAGQERRRFDDGRPPPSATPPSSGTAHVPQDDELDLRAAADRVVLLDEHGARLHVEQLVGDVPDPGVVLALLYESVTRDAAGRPVPLPPPGECRQMLAAIARADTEIAAKRERHLASADATLMARLDVSA